MVAALPRRPLTRSFPGLAVTIAFFAWGWLFASPAGAHSFLVSAAPAQGQRLAGSPEAVVLEFNEAVDLAAARLEVRTADGDALATASPELASGELAVRLPLPELDDDIYVVTSEAVSAVDGHGTSGEFAFGVGEVTGEVPAPSTDSPTSRWSTVAGWLFFAGFAVSAGGLAFRVLADGAAAPTAGAVRSRGRYAVRAGLLVAGAGAAVAVVALPAGAATGTTLLALGTVALLATASLLCTLTRQPLPALGALFGAAATWSAGSHAVTADGFTGSVVDLVHLAAGGVWAGLLVFVAAELWSSRRRGTPLAPVVARYARLAVGLVIVLGAAGVISAFQLLNSWSDLVDTGYGRLVLAESVLFTLALGLASPSRWRGIAGRRLGLLRRAVTAESVTVAVALVLAALLVGGAPPIAASTAATLLGPAPLAVARDAGLAGQLNVEVATEGRRLDIDVFSPEGPVAGTRIEASASEAGREDESLVPRPCGQGCFTQAFTPRADATTVTVEATAPGWEGGTFDAVLTWPPGPTAGDRLAAVIATMRAIPTLEMTETVTSGPGSVVTPSTFMLSGEELIAAEPHGAGNVEARVGGGDGNTLRLYLAGSQVFAELQLDDLDRITSARMVTPATTFAARSVTHRRNRERHSRNERSRRSGLRVNRSARAEAGHARPADARSRRGAVRPARRPREDRSRPQLARCRDHDETGSTDLASSPTSSPPCPQHRTGRATRPQGSPSGSTFSYRQLQSVGHDDVNEQPSAATAIVIGRPRLVLRGSARSARSPCLR